MRSRIGLLLLVLLMAGISPRPSLTQDDGSSCSTLVKQALTQVGNNCGQLGRNNACYGFNRVEATFAQTQSDAFFSKPSDKAEINALQSIGTAPLDTSLEQWGIAVLSVQANVPNTLPGQSVRFVLLGDVNVENAVSPEDAFQPAATPAQLTTKVPANVRTSASPNANILGSVAAGTALAADAISADGNWLRVAFQNAAPGWINKSVVQTSDDLSKLPVYNRTSRAPMQAFYFRGNVGQPSCQQSPSLLVVQGPEKFAVDITANGADIRIGSTIVLRKTASDRMAIIVINGGAKIGVVVIPSGFTVEAPLGSDGKSVDGPLTNLRPLTQEELDGLQVLEDIPPDVLNYPIQVPTEEEIQRILALYSRPGQQPGQTSGGGGKVNCAPFRLTSPLDGWAVVPTTFYWDAAPGANGYRLNVSGLASVTTPATNATVDLGSVSGNGMTWSVDALLDGQVVCTAGPASLPRDTRIAPPTVQKVCPSTAAC
jgi:hypothetical protein